MKSSKKLLSLFALLSLVFGLALAGCGQKSEEEQAASDLAGQAEASSGDMEKAAQDMAKDAEKLKEEAEKSMPSN